MTYDPVAAYEERMVAVNRCMDRLAKKKGVSALAIKTRWRNAYSAEVKDRLVSAEVELMRKEAAELRHD